MNLRRSVFISTLALSLFGMVMIYSASSYAADLSTGDPFFYLKKQAFGFAVGLPLMIGASKFKIDILRKYGWAVYLFSMGLLLILFIPGVGQESYGAVRWINLGFITFQSSEFAKFGLVIFLAGLLDKHPPERFRSLLLPLAAGLAMCAAIIMEPNLSITICVAAVLFIMLFVSGMRGRHVALFLAAGVTAIIVLIFAEPYRISRLLAFLDPWASPKAEGYQLIQSYYALGSGGFFGLGLFNGRQKYLYLPFAESDFIFAVIGEELGVLGSVAVIAVFLWLIVSGVLIAVRAESRFKTFLAAGITAVIAVQTVLNIAVVSGSIPPTGLPLPYISAGGSSLMIFMAASGMLINLAPQQNPAKLIVCSREFFHGQIHNRRRTRTSRGYQSTGR